MNDTSHPSDRQSRGSGFPVIERVLGEATAPAKASRRPAPHNRRPADTDPRPEENMPHPHDTPDLESFATALADELPGHWRSEYHRHHEHSEQLSGAQDVWDMNLVSAALATYDLGHDAVLSRDDGARLYVIGRPRMNEEYLVAAMAPSIAPEAFRGIPEPDGIAVPDDPFRAAEDIAVDLLPRYDKALAQAQHNAAAAPRQSAPASGPERVVMTWAADGQLVASAESEAAAAALRDNGFLYHEQQQTYVLAGDDTAVQASFVRAAGTQLAAHGIGVVMRHPASKPALETTGPAAPAQVQPAAHTR